MCTHLAVLGPNGDLEDVDALAALCVGVVDHVQLLALPVNVCGRVCVWGKVDPTSGPGRWRKETTHTHTYIYILEYIPPPKSLRAHRSK